MLQQFLDVGASNPPHSVYLAAGSNWTVAAGRRSIKLMSRICRSTHLRHVVSTVPIFTGNTQTLNCLLCHSSQERHHRGTAVRAFWPSSLPTAWTRSRAVEDLSGTTLSGPVITPWIRRLQIGVHLALIKMVEYRRCIYLPRLLHIPALAARLSAV